MVEYYEAIKRNKIKRENRKMDIKWMLHLQPPQVTSRLQIEKQSTLENIDRLTEHSPDS